MIRVAIAAENADYDGRIFERLLSLCLGSSIKGEFLGRDLSNRGFGPPPGGCNAVRALIAPFLAAADAEGIGHALVAIDNDGGARRRPEHAHGHDVVVEAADRKAGCRWCWLRAAVPARWQEPDRRLCLGVPVQTIETWLLCAGGRSPAEPPERAHDRPALKRAFWGGAKPDAAEGLRMALDVLASPEALIRLRERPSFVQFENQLAGWLPSVAATATPSLVPA